MDVELRKEQKDIEFKKMQRIYAESNMTPYLYGNKNRYLNDKSKEMVDIIHGNMDEIRYDESYAFHILKKIMPHEKVVKEILQYELLNYSPKEKVNSLEELVKVLKSALYKFQYKVGGFNIEDKDWIVANKDNKRFKVKENQTVLYNSVEKKNCDKELMWFLEKIVSYAQNFIDGDKFNIKYTLKEDDRFRVVWIILRVESIIQN